MGTNTLEPDDRENGLPDEYKRVGEPYEDE